MTHLLWTRLQLASPVRLPPEQIPNREYHAQLSSVNPSRTQSLPGVARNSLHVSLSHGSIHGADVHHPSRLSFHATTSVR